MKLDTPNQLSRTSLALHWIVGLTMIGLLAVGVYMVETETRSLYSWHKSFGFVIFFVILLRVVWQLKNGWTTPVGKYQHIEQLGGVLN
jgi:cytochrome b561